MLAFALVFAAGCCLPALSVPVGWGLVALGWACPARFGLLRLLAVLGTGLLWSGWHARQALQAWLPPDLEGQEIEVRGRVRGLPVTRPDGSARFRFSVECRYLADGHCRPMRLEARLGWYQKRATKKRAAVPVPRLAPGQRWRLYLRLKRPRGYANPGGYDYAATLIQKGIAATGYVRRPARAKPLGEDDDPTLFPDRVRYALRTRIESMDSRVAPLLVALGLGARDGLTQAQRDVLRATGTSHLLAISGLHVGLVAVLARALVCFVWRRAGLGLLWPAPLAGRLAVLPAALAYALLAGFGLPTQRALIMLTVWVLAGFSPRRLPPGSVWSLALVAVLLFDPLAILAPGFWLSFLAVAAILWLHAGEGGRRGRAVSMLRVQLLLALLLLVPGWALFGTVAPWAAVANLFAIPWVSFLVVPPLLAGLLCGPLPAAQDFLLQCAAFGLDTLWWLLERLAALPASPLYLPPLSPAWWLVTAAGLMLLTARPSGGLRPLGLIVLLAVPAGQVARPAPGDLWVQVLDVGQGLAVVLQTRNRLLVYDTGPAYPGGFNTGEAVLVPWLRQAGYRFIDWLVLSHADRDHAGGLNGLLKHFPVGKLLSGEPGELPFRDIRPCAAGQHWVWDGVHFEMLAPLRPGAEGNAASCVLRASAGDGRAILLPGDIGRREESALLAAGRGRLQAEVLLAPHHGSRHSSGPGFVRAVAATYVVFSRGYLNRFGFPDPAVRARYLGAGAQLLDTARDGALELRLEAGRPIRPRAWRRQWRFGIRPAPAD